jgi:tetratricopeptide (TPR) repeat protein
VDLGQLEQALQTYSKLATRDRHSAQIGSAHAYRIFGSLHEALRIYDEELVDLPNDCVALCGRGEVLKDIGKLDLALAAFELAIRNSPYRPEPVAGKVNILRNMGRFDEALRVNNEARSRFHSDRRFEFALIAIYRAQGRYSEALVALDRFNAKFPFDARGRVARAAILSRLSAVDEAMGVYESILAERPHLHGASMGKAALLIRLRRYSEAAAILQPNKYPSTRSDWRTSTLRAFLVEAMEGYQVASELLNDLIRRCPFASERRRMRDLLATVELRQGHWVGARNLVESNPEELSNVIILRVLATTHRTGKAREYLARIRQSDGPADIADLAEEIARRHRITEEAPRHSGDWIETTERNILLADAA